MSENLTVRRRQNVLSLFQSFAERALSSGTPPKGLEQAFATALQISPSMWSQIKSQRPIGDKLARQIERLSAQPNAWLDQQHGEIGLTEAERAFLDLALKVWRSENASGKRVLRGDMLTRLKR
jgi:hypothetical protein